MPLRVDRLRITFQCDGDGCGRSISIEQGVMSPPNIFADAFWQVIEGEDGNARFYCAEHRRVRS
jgi:hypothetical protein